MKHIKLFESISEKLYHGNRKGDFPPEKKRFAGAIFLTSNLEFAKHFSGFNERDEFPNGAVWEVVLKENVNLCDPMEIKTMADLGLKDVIQKMIDDKYVDEASGTKFNEVAGSGFKGYDPDTDKEFDIKDRSESVYFYLWRIKNGAWRIIECNPIIEKIKQAGFDGFYVTERGSKNVAVFDENSIKSFEKMPEFSGSGETEIKEGNLSLALDWNKKIPSTGNMRHLKRYNQLFENQQELTQEQKDWLDKCTFGKWTVNPQTGLVDVDMSFNCSGQGPIGFNGVKFGRIVKNFDCSESGLTSLEGAPLSVGGDFYCYGNQLTSLKGAPQSVGGDFDCGDNSLTSLEGAPESVGRDFSCSDNFLVSLEGAPQSVGRDFVCNYNQLVSLKGAPQKVANDFKCIGNPLTSLEGAPQSVGRQLYFIYTPISDAIATRVLRLMSEKKIPLEQAVSDLWDLIPEDDRIYLAKHNPDLSQEKKREYLALERFKKKVI